MKSGPDNFAVPNVRRDTRNPPLTYAQIMSQSTVSETCFSQGSPCISSCWSRSGPSGFECKLSSCASQPGQLGQTIYMNLIPTDLILEESKPVILRTSVGRFNAWKVSFVPIRDVMVRYGGMVSQGSPSLSSCGF